MKKLQKRKTKTIVVSIILTLRMNDILTTLGENHQ